ncbi:MULTISPECIES: DUF2750 domain-containing protein [Chryseobacterium]|uniref:DUF2750 domain-containing protein n=1 Tax=Chryseobacterium camelliae TaxID=1265445 RepID=A0ABU0TKV7_9FLAO|nr:MULTISPECIES: DUF2750 domain-containing protein [Chryseobacterium]MDT3408466.1 hypothetical protein [Pseudacidovorax intermedius]MDQ1097678.1 hypothetical protein [Chryseobacterium camelliae]MDQ1101607.1 hypothetical protein [Chryseobacterium sp. SORGH_AS_1048]MDR6085050.1 hypothetical protein [Chryseobacterium sp. SORGH_AS_0909]MDR6129405.1 hypothetical protein [Chryseobacterium sp. SORGH_AS_1175]
MADINKKIGNILRMSENERYDYFIRKVADFEVLWGLDDNGWALLGDNEGRQVLPLWPEKEFAELCAIDQWEGFKPKEISLNDFFEKWIPGMTNDNTLVNIFLTPEEKGSVISPKDLGVDLQNEAEQYE